MADEADVIRAHYESGDYERERLGQGGSRIELARTKELLLRFLPPAPATVLDVGGGPGLYATWLTSLGYTVTLVDLTPLHVQQALDAARALDRPFEARVGDARDLDFADHSFDVVLLLGPLYHLVERSDRLTALREAKRVARAGGMVVVAAISRLASVLDAVRLGFILDPSFRSVVQRDITEGQHRNPTGRPGWFTTAYFHRPNELRRELQEAGLEMLAVFGVEGPGWLREELWDDPSNHEAVLAAARMIEEDQDGTALSAHLLAVAHA